MGMRIFRRSSSVRSIISGIAFAAAAVGQLHGGIKDELKGHLSGLSSPEARTRERALMSLWDLASAGKGLELAMPGIISAVSDSDSSIRGLACHSLLIAGNTLPGAYLGELRSAIFPLSRAILDKDATVREQAVMALASVAGRLSKDEDTLALLPLWHAVDQLGTVGEMKADLKEHANTIRRALRSLQQRADELGQRTRE